MATEILPQPEPMLVKPDLSEPLPTDAEWEAYLKGQQGSGRVLNIMLALDNVLRHRHPDADEVVKLRWMVMRMQDFINGR